MMGGVIDWSALPVVAEVIGINDIESLIADLRIIRDYQNERRN